MQRLRHFLVALYVLGSMGIGNVALGIALWRLVGQDGPAALGVSMAIAYLFSIIGIAIALQSVYFLRYPPHAAMGKIRANLRLFSTGRR